MKVLLFVLEILLFGGGQAFLSNVQNIIDFYMKYLK